VRVGRLGSAAAWISAVCCLPYLVLKVAWTADVPLGISDRSVLHGSGWVAGNALMAVIQLAGLLLVLALTRPWARRVPVWVLLFPVWVGTGLLFEVAVGAMLTGLFPPASQDSGGDADLGGIQSWVYVLVYASFAGQGVALAIAFACHVRARWGPLLGGRTGEVLAKRTDRVRTWPEEHLGRIAELGAAMMAAVAVVSLYWAAGGSVALSGSQSDPAGGVQAARVAAAVVAGIGLLALAGRWAQRTRFWLPAALTWMGSGAVAAFDGLRLAVNRLFLVFGAAASELGWTLTDTLVAFMVVTGVLAAAVGAVAITAAARDKQVESSREAHPARRHQVGTRL
jgi:hypothetical protein